MKKNRITIITSICIFTLIGSIFGYVSLQNNDKLKLYNGLPVNMSSGILLYDTDDLNQAVGISDYVFMAKVNKILRTEYKNPIEIEVSGNRPETKIVTDPYTIYSITVIENIKGELLTSKPIEFMQYGGINEDGKSYTFLNNCTLLNEGEYYVLMVDTWGGKGGTIEIADSNRIIALGTNLDLTKKATVIFKYKIAYSNEKIPASGEGILKNKEKFMSKYDVNYSTEIIKDLEN